MTSLKRWRFLMRREVKTGIPRSRSARAVLSEGAAASIAGAQPIIGHKKCAPTGIDFVNRSRGEIVAGWSIAIHAESLKNPLISRLLSLEPGRCDKRGVYPRRHDHALVDAAFGVDQAFEPSKTDVARIIDVVIWLALRVKASQATSRRGALQHRGVLEQQPDAPLRERWIARRRVTGKYGSCLSAPMSSRRKVMGLG